MIEELRIRGLGVIDSALLTFADGLTVLTGETGAGKTMILTSLRLLMGDKADSTLVRDDHGQIEIDGIIVPNQSLEPFLSELGIAETEELIISRTVPRSGRSRSVIDGRPVPIKTLADITNKVVTIHGQADQWRVRRGQVQRQMVDAYCGLKHLKLLDRYGEAWQRAVTLKRQLDEIRSSHDQRIVEIQYLSELVDDIDNLNIRDNEEELLEQEIDRLSNASDLRADVRTAVRLIAGGDEESVTTNKDILDDLSHSLQSLRHASRFDSSITISADELEQVQSKLQDLSQELNGYLESLQDDPEELSRLHSRRAELDNLMKGRAENCLELQVWAQKARERLNELNSLEANPEVVEENLSKAQNDVLKIGEQLSLSRKKGALLLSETVNEELHALAMPNATFSISFESQKPTSHGLEELTMELQAHPDAPTRPLGEGASGGELSRVMLALEVALGEKQNPSTYVFDEVDAGIGGRTATEIGRRLAKLAVNQQVVVVTHLPQVAAFADRHLVVEKNEGLTNVREVNGEERVEEIVRMLGGEIDSLAARRHALELLGNISWQNHESE